MIKLEQLFTAIKEENLNKYQLEGYYKELSELYSQMHLEMADNKKLEALFMVKNPEEATASMKRKWKATAEGQRGIELSGLIRATAAQLRSLKSRLYNTY